jgi:hypothetical protein
MLHSKDIHITLCGMSKVRNVQRNVELVGNEPDLETQANVLAMVQNGIDKDDPLGFKETPAHT